MFVPIDKELEPRVTHFVYEASHAVGVKEIFGQRGEMGVENLENGRYCMSPIHDRVWQMSIIPIRLG